MNEPKSDYVKVVIYTPAPKALSPQVISKPFVLYAMPEYPTVLGSVVALPNVMELWGGSSGGGGPPGFATTQYKGSIRMKRPLMLAGFLAGKEVKLHDEHFTVSLTVGTVVSAAVALTYMQLAPAVGEHPETEEEVVKLIEGAGYTAVPLIEYRTPDMILNAIKAQQAPVVVPNAPEG